MVEIDKITEELIINFLKTEYPITKLRDKRRFRRGIILKSYIDNENGFGFLKPKEELKKTYEIIYLIINNTFGISEYETNVVALKYLGLL